MAPPVAAKLPDGVVLELHSLAVEITDRHLRGHPDDVERYGEVARAWGIHDNQHLLNWAVLDVRGLLSFPEQLQWLANVLGSRGYPLANLADNLETAAQVVRQLVDSQHAGVVADTLEAGAGQLRGLTSSTG
jgi:hypothetical protein